MGCSTSVEISPQPTKNGKEKKQSSVPKFTVQHEKEKSSFVTSLKIENETMSVTEVHGTNLPVNKPVLEEHVHNKEVNIKSNNLETDENIEAKLPETETSVTDDLTNEEEDKFDITIEPTKHTKEHATQNTLEFIYHNSYSNSPSQATGGFHTVPAASVLSSGTHQKNLVNKRRPSGVPPPARELKPGDFLYQRNLSNNFEFAEEDEEEEEEKNNERKNT